MPKVVSATDETHVCSRCHCTFSIGYFGPRRSKGWRDKEGQIRSHTCRDCVQDVSRISRELAAQRQAGGMLVGYGHLEVQPFRDWLVKQRRIFCAENGIDASKHPPNYVPVGFAVWVGIQERRVWQIFNADQSYVRVDLVDRALTHCGQHLWELYGHLYEEDTAA